MDCLSAKSRQRLDALSPNGDCYVQIRDSNKRVIYSTVAVCCIPFPTRELCLFLEQDRLTLTW
jgi:hypothetical protein